MIKNPDRALVGLATPYNQSSYNDGRVWRAEQFDDFIARGMGIPVRLNHGPLISSRGCIRYIGKARAFASVVTPVDGLLGLVELDDGPEMDELLADLGRLDSFSYLPGCWGLSLGAHVWDDACEPFEISIVYQPAHPDARILAAGPRALEVWRSLTEVRKAVI